MLHELILPSHSWMVEGQQPPVKPMALAFASNTTYQTCA